MNSLFLFTPLLIINRPIQRVFAGGSLILFVVSAFVGMWATYDPALSWPVLLSTLISVSLFLVVAFAGISPWWVSRGLVTMASLCALYFISQYAHFDYQDEVGLLADLGRMTGPLMPDLVLFIPHPNAVAGFLEGILLLSLVLTREAGGGSRWVWGVMSALIAYALLITGSRGAWLGLAVAMGVWAILTFRARALQLAVVGFGLVVGMLAGVYVVMRLASPDQHVLILSSVFDTAQSRFVLYRNSFQLLKDYLFTGIGLGDTFAMVYSRYQLLIHVPYLYYAHNHFLSVGLGQGILGLVAFIGLILTFYHFVIRVERVGLGKEIRPLFRAAWLGVTVSLGHGLTDSVQFSQAWWTMPMLFALAGLAVASGRPALGKVHQQADNGSSSKQRSDRKWLGVAAASVVILLMMLVLVWRPLAAAWYANIGAVYQTQADLSPEFDEAAREAAASRAVTLFERTLSLDPAHAVANYRLGMMALDRRDFEQALSYLQRAYTREPGDQGVIKALGYAYLYTGQLDAAEARFREIEFESRLLGELNYWHWWWGTQERDDLATYAGEMAQRLSE